jgi:ring-1,2-phenylacetyl-CoA epoxidase subunit PaaE
MAEQFHSLTVSSARAIAGDAVEVVFDVPEALQAQFAFKPGQHIVVRADCDGNQVERTYSICSGRRGPLRIGIRHVANGAFSGWVKRSLASGAALEVAAPAGRFTLPPSTGSGRHLLMLAAGAGITPILGMTIEALETEPETRVTLVYGSRRTSDAMFLSELEDLKDRFPTRFDLVHVLSRPGEAECELLGGRITGEKLKALAACRIPVSEIQRAFLCGPGDFIKSTRNALFELGMARDLVHHEFFIGRTGSAPVQPVTPTPTSEPDSAAQPRDAIALTVILDGQRHTVPLARGQNVLEAALAAGLKPPHSCTAGMCSTCRARIVEGTVTLTQNFSLEPWEIERGFTLTCQAVATSGQLVIDYDAM